MKQHSKTKLALIAALLVTGTAAHAGEPVKQTSKATHHTAHRAKRTRRVERESASSREMREMREQMARQQEQIDALRGQISTRDQQLASAQQSATEAQQQVATAAAATAAAAAMTTQNAQDVQQLKVSVGDLSTKSDVLTETVVKNQAQVEQQISSPTALHYKGVTIQPVGFAEFAGVWRQRSVNSGINTPFNTIPFPGSSEGHISELNFTGRQSRVGALVSGDTGRFKLAGYVEADFLSAGITSNNNQSDSYTLRFRQFWGQVAKPSGFTLTAGQMWSLVTENLRSTDNRTEVLPNTIDPQYMVGFSWERQPAIRLQQTFGDPRSRRGGFTAAMSLEQAQLTNVTVSSTVSSAIPSNNFFAGSGTGGGLYNPTATYANNVAPDVLVKFAWDTPHAHVEAGGMARFMRDVYYPVLTATSPGYLQPVTRTYSTQQQHDTKVAGGAFASVRVAPVKFFDVGIQAMAGDGVGRYGSAQLADATIRPDGTLEPLRNYHGLLSLVTHEGKNWDVFAYYGGEYAQRTIYSTAGANLIGYGPYNLNNTGCYALPPNTPATDTAGSPGTTNCASPTRYIQEAMFGFVYRAYNSPKYGRLQYSATYQYLQRNLWSGAVATGLVSGPRAQDSMIHASMRYYIP